MGLIKNLALTVAAIGLFTTASAALAAPVQFSISNAIQGIGSGYGQDGNETPNANPTRLDVRFTTLFTPQNPLNFSLDAINDGITFDIGGVNFQEPNTGGGILAAETDHLGVNWAFTIANPFASLQTITATASAATGSVSDTTGDYLLHWNPLMVNFGTAGLFSIRLNDLAFSQQGLQTQSVTFTLLAFDPGNALPPIEIEPQTIPEPGSMLLVGLGLAGLGLTRRQRGL